MKMEKRIKYLYMSFEMQFFGGAHSSSVVQQSGTVLPYHRRSLHMHPNCEGYEEQWETVTRLCEAIASSFEVPESDWKN